MIHWIGAIRWKAWGAVAALGLTGCLFGGGSETEAVRASFVLSGLVLTPSGAPLPNATVKLFPSGYDPTAPGTWANRSVITDSAGRFVFVEGATLFATKAAQKAYYALVVRAPDGLRWGFADSLRTRWDNSIDTLTVSAPRRLVISLHTNTTFTTNVAGTAFLRGTDFLLSLDGNGPWALDSVPFEAVRLVLRANSGWSKAVNLSPRDPQADAYLMDTLRIYGAPTGVRIEQ